MDALPFALLLLMLINASSMFEFHMLVVAAIMFYILELIMEIVPNYPTIQKPNCRQFPQLTMAGFADALRPDKFTGVHFKRWQIKATLWLAHLKVFEVSKGIPEGTISDEDQKKVQGSQYSLRWMRSECSC